MGGRLLLTGAGGILGRQMIARCPSEWTLDAHTRDTLDVSDAAEVRAVIEAARPDVVVHAGAMTAVDLCETEVDRAFRVNGMGTGLVAEAAHSVGALMVYISTDYVFDGTAHEPYREYQPVAPRSVYGESKEWGERLVRELCPRHVIARTQWVYGEGGANFVDTMLKVAAQGKPLKVVDDQHGSPTSTTDLAQGIYRLLEGRPGLGTFHLSAQGATTWYGFAQEIFRLVGWDPTLSPCRTDEFPRPAPRPAYGVLENWRLAQTIGDPMPSWSEGLAAHIETLDPASYNPVGAVADAESGPGATGGSDAE